MIVIVMYRYEILYSCMKEMLNKGILFNDHTFTLDGLFPAHYHPTSTSSSSSSINNNNSNNTTTTNNTNTPTTNTNNANNTKTNTSHPNNIDIPNAVLLQTIEQLCIQYMHSTTSSSSNSSSSSSSSSYLPTFLLQSIPQEESLFAVLLHYTEVCLYIIHCMMIV